MTESDLPVVSFHPYRWGNPDQPAELPARAAGALGFLGITPPAEPPREPGEVDIPATNLPDDVQAALAAAVGADNVSTDKLVRLAHANGFSTPDLLRLRAGDGSESPDAVVYPGSHEDVLRVLAIAAKHRLAVVPFAGGTSVVGGLSPVRGGFNAVIALDVRRLDQVLNVDRVSRTATLQAGMRGPAVEKALGEHGFTLGHFPQSYEGASIGGYAAARSAGQSSAGFGRFDEMVVGMTVATPQGTIELGTAPRSAAGPDLRQLFLGSEGALGVLTSVTVRVRPVPEVRVFEGWKFSSFSEGAAALRKLAQDGPLPTVLRLSDESETAINLADPTGSTKSAVGGCLAITGYEGTVVNVAARRVAATTVIEAAGGEALGEEAGEAWRTGRYRGPYLRDPLLDAGALVETLETVTFWSNIDALKTAVTEALTASLTEQGTTPMVMCHISHVYETGACLYFTVICAQTADPIAQWSTAKTAANEAIRASGAACTHHHGVGRDHRDIYHREVGPLAIDALRAVKQTLDPHGILNPGILI